MRQQTGNFDFKQYLRSTMQKRSCRSHGGIVNPTVITIFNRRASSGTLENWIELNNIHSVYGRKQRDGSGTSWEEDGERGICVSGAAEDYRLLTTFAAKPADRRRILSWLNCLCRLAQNISSPGRMPTNTMLKQHGKICQSRLTGTHHVRRHSPVHASTGRSCGLEPRLKCLQWRMSSDPSGWPARLPHCKRCTEASS